MASREVQLTAQWREVSAASALDLAAREAVRLYVAEAHYEAVVRLAETDSAAAPVGVVGEALFPPARRRGSATETNYTLPPGGARLWARVDHGPATLGAREVAA